MLKSCGFLKWVVAICVFASIADAGAGTVAIRTTPILNASLPSGTYQVETSTNGTTWLPTGVIVSGHAAASSIRLDGFSDRLNFRYATFGREVIVTPTVTRGLSLSNSFPGATELRIESATTLASNAWNFRQFVFPDFNGAFITAVTAPTQALAFYRALQPGTPLVVATITGYTADPSLGYAGFGAVADDMPQLYRDGFICAPCPTLYHRDGSNAASAGECYELTGPVGTTTVMVGDINDVPPPGTCDVGLTYFDIGTAAYTNLFAEANGFRTATCRLVPAPLTGNVKLLTVQNSGGYYLELRPYNHRAGVSQLEIRGHGGTWTNLPRTAYNSFVYTGSSPVAFPLDVRVTSRFGEIVGFPPLGVLSAGQRFTASNQFAFFPESSPAPVWIIPTVYADSLGNVLGGKWSAAPYGGATVNPADPGAAYQGTAGLSVSNYGAFNGVIFFSPCLFQKPVDGSLEFAIQSPTGTPATNLTVTIVGVNESGLTANSSSVPLPAIGSAWQTIRIPLEPALAPFRIQEFRIVNNSSAASPPVNLDSIRFSQP